MTTRYVIRMRRAEDAPIEMWTTDGWRDKVDCRRRRRYVYCFETAADAVRLMGATTFRRSVELARPLELSICPTEVLMKVASTDALCHVGPEDME